MLNNASGFRRIYLATGYTDLRRGMEGLASIIKFNFQLDPYQKDILFLFCGRRTDRIKGLVWEGDGFLLLYKRLELGAFNWPRTKEEALEITPEQYQYLMQGLEVVAEEAFTADSKTDFSTQLQKAQSAGAELVFLPIYYTEASIILTQADSMGYAPTFFGCDGLDGLDGCECQLPSGFNPFALISLIADSCSFGSSVKCSLEWSILVNRYTFSTTLSSPSLVPAISPQASSGTQLLACASIFS